ncbi:response regulator transcription factor [Mesorhizobium sp. WSM2239]
MSTNHRIAESSAATGGFAGNRERERSIIIVDNRARERERPVQNVNSSHFRAAVAVFGTIDELRRAYEHRRGPISAILLNIGGCKITDDGVAQDIEQLKSEFAAIPFVIVADNNDPAQIANALETGACGYIPTTVGIGVAVGAIELALAGGACVPASCTFSMRQRVFARNIQGAQPIRKILTARQIEVAEALRCGKANKIIAYELNLRESTVKVHIRKIMKKLNATNRTEAVYKMDTMLLRDAPVSG